jgi:hypothetical protein
MPTLKQSIIEAAEHYERKAEIYRNRAGRASAGSNMQHELTEVYKYNLGRARAMREAIEYIEEFLG